MSDIQVTDNPEKNQYEAHIDGELAGVAQYELRGDDLIAFTHTAVEAAHEGKGVGSALARVAMDDALESGQRQVVPECPFFSIWIGKHPTYKEIVHQQ